MNKIIIKLFLLVLVVIGCSDKSTILEPIAENPITPVLNNPVFIKNIYGTWCCGTTTVSFDSSYNFVKSWQLVFPDKSTLVTQIGKYEIVDSVLVLKTSEWKFSNPDAFEGLSILPVYEKVDFKNGKLILNQVRVLSKEDSNTTELKGVWKMTLWVYEKTTTPNKVEYVGRLDEYYKFSSDSVTTSQKYLDGNPFQTFSWNWKYSYKPPLITIDPPVIENDTVEFKNNKMYWYRRISDIYTRTN